MKKKNWSASTSQNNKNKQINKRKKEKSSIR